MKGVFDTKPGSGYNDLLPERYHFPARSNYMTVAQAVKGDWILYREPQRNRGRRAYIGTGRVTAVEPDPEKPDHAYAFVDEFFEFCPPVAFAGSPDRRYWETPLKDAPDPSRVGQTLQGKSMRLISEADFGAIVSAGLGETLSPTNLVRYGPGLNSLDELWNPDFPDAPDKFVRRVEQTLLNRKVRDANFRRLICRAYDDTCAVTGLRIINGGGRSEVQAAHIWSVERGGPDVVPNGIALSGTVHWMFDRHLISLTDDYRLLVAHNRIPEDFRSLFERQMDRIRLPEDQAQWPHPKYVRLHREAFGTA